MVSTSNDSFFDGVMKDIERSSWSHHCSPAARAVLRGESLHDAILYSPSPIRAVQLILVKNLRNVEEPLAATASEETHAGFTPLMTALVARNADIVRLLLAYGASPAARCAADANNSVLHYACAYRVTESLPLLLMSLQRHTILRPNDLGETPLHVAARRCFPDVIEALLGHCAALYERELQVHRKLHGDDVPCDPDQLTKEAVTACDLQGNTFVHHLVAHPRADTPFAACLARVLAAVQRHGAQGIANALGQTTLFVANSPSAVEVLAAELPPGELPLDTHRRASPLHHAAAHCSAATVVAMCRAFAAHGPTMAPRDLVRLATSDGDTCLHNAARGGKADNMAVLLDQLRGAAIAGDEVVDVVVFAKNVAGDSVFHVAAAHGAADCIARLRQFMETSALDDAVRAKVVQEVLAQRNTSDVSPVLIAAASDADAALQALVEVLAAVGAVPCCRAAQQCHWVRRNTTALHLSLACGAQRSAKVLLDTLLDATHEEAAAVLLAPDDDGNTCLMAAVQSGSLDAIHVVLANAPEGAAVPQQVTQGLAQRNKQGQTLADLVAAQCGMRRAATSLPSSPLKRLAAEGTLPSLAWEATGNAAIGEFARQDVCSCDRRRPCIARAARTMIVNSCAGKTKTPVAVAAALCDL